MDQNKTIITVELWYFRSSVLEEIEQQTMLRT